MGKKGSWFSAVKKVLGCENKKKEKENQKSRKWFRKKKSLDLDCSSAQTATMDPAPAFLIEQMTLMEAENEQNKHSYSTALASDVASAQAAAEVVLLTAAASDSGKLKEEGAAIKIQTAFRGYLARRALRAFRGLVRLQTMIQGQSVKRQTASTLRHMQTLARLQSQIRARRNTMFEENLDLQRQLQQKDEKEQEKLISFSGDDWNDSTQSREQIEAKLQSKHEAAMRRERALAYAYTHQQTQKHSSKATNQTFTDPNNPHWGWSWLERRMASRPWEGKRAFDKELNSVQDTANIPTKHATSADDLSRRDFHLVDGPSPTAHKQSRLPSRHSLSTPRTKPGRMSSASPRGSNADGDSRGMARASTSAVPSRTSTESAKAKSRLPSPLGLEKKVTPEKGTGNSAKKRLSFSTSPRGPRRNSDPQR